jgi:MarR family transcriptional regulator, organic hydroperoxide resistance regulator
MSISRPVGSRRRRKQHTPSATSATVSPLTARGNARVVFALPATVSRVALLDNGSDERFRQLVYDLFTIAARMETVREHLARRIGITAPQYGVVMAIARLQGKSGVSVGALAEVLHVSSAFIASETGKLARQGLVMKRQNPEDRRGVLLILTRAARHRIARLTPEIRAVNDLFFGPLNRAAFEGLAAASGALVHSSHNVIQRLRLFAAEAGAMPEAAE